MRAAIRSGRCPVPPEWRAPLGLRFWQRTAIVAVTGASNKTAVFDILSGHLPLVPYTGEPGEHAQAAEPHLTSSPPGGAPAGTITPPAVDSALAEDTEMAQRMTRRLLRLWPARGVRELAKAGFIPLHLPAVYAWRRLAQGEHVYRAWPDGQFTPVAVFRRIQAYDRRGRWREEFVAGRPW